jgi:hypothetical protein
MAQELAVDAVHSSVSAVHDLEKWQQKREAEKQAREQAATNGAILAGAHSQHQPPKMPPIRMRGPMGGPLGMMEDQDSSLGYDYEEEEAELAELEAKVESVSVEEWLANLGIPPILAMQYAEEVKTPRNVCCKNLESQLAGLFC